MKISDLLNFLPTWKSQLSLSIDLYKISSSNSGDFFFVLSKQGKSHFSLHTNQPIKNHSFHSVENLCRIYPLPRWKSQLFLSFN